MTDQQKTSIRYLRLEKQGYKAIASILGLTESTVKSFCRRTGLTCDTPERDTHCRNCGEELRHNPGHRARKFCSDACRQSWWRDHPQLMRRDTGQRACAHCGQEFDSYKEEQRYCSHGCYVKARFGREDQNGRAV